MFHPDYDRIVRIRQARLNELRKNPKAMKMVKQHYGNNPWDLVNDWGWTFEPRNAVLGKPTFMPFILWPKQREYLQWLQGRLLARERGIVDKSRDCGVTWLCAAFAVSHFLFTDGFVTGFGSRKLELVDTLGDPRCIFEKVRMFLRMIPPDFYPKGFDWRKHSSSNKLLNPETLANIFGEGGDDIGRGARSTIYFVDEAAFVERQLGVDSSLSNTTEVQIDVSTVNGSGNEFYKKLMRFDKTDKKFVFDWTDDPRKDNDWYQKQVAELDPVTVAQEIDRDPDASQEDIFIPSKWVRASIDAHIKLGFRPSGIRKTGYDPADEGDAKAVVHMHGNIVMQARQKKSGDITQAMPWAFDEADEFRADTMIYDADGMGAPAMKLSLHNMGGGRMRIVGYHGSAGVMNPGQAIKRVQRNKKKFKDGKTALLANVNETKTNGDTYSNFKSQTWTWLRDRFEATYLAVEAANAGHIVHVDPDDLISISSDCEELQQLTSELSRPKRIWRNNGKIEVEQKHIMKSRGVDSPNLAEALVMANSNNQAVERVDNDPPPLPDTDPWDQSIEGVM